MSKRVRRRRLFLHELAGLTTLAIPIVVNQLGQIGMGTADTIMVGPLGPPPLAAVGLGSAVHHFGLILATGTLMGMAPLVSQAHGAGERDQCRRVFVQGFWLTLLLSIPVMMLCYWGEDVARLLGQQPEVAVLAGGYLRAIVIGIPPALLFVAIRQYLEGMGHVTAPMVVTFFGLALNIVANRAFIHGVGDWIPALGMVGTGWATSLVRWAMAGAMVVFLMTHRELNPARGALVRPNPVLLRAIMKIGTPIGAQFGLEVGLFAFAAVMMGWLGALELAAHQVTINIAATTFMVALGLSVAGSIRVGQHIGAGRTRAVRRAVVATYLLATGFMLLCALLFLLIPHQLMGIYTPHEDVIDLGAKLLLVAAAFQVFDGAQVAGMSVLRGAAETRGPTLIAALGYWGVGLPVGFLLAFRAGMGAVGIWIGLSLGLAAVALLLLVRIRQVLWLRAVTRV